MTAAENSAKVPRFCKQRAPPPRSNCGHMSQQTPSKHTKWSGCDVPEVFGGSCRRCRRPGRKGMQTQPICCGSRAEGRTGEAGSAGLHLWSLVLLHSCDAMGAGAKD